MKKIIWILIAGILLIGLADAVEEEHEEIFAQAEKIIEQKISCSELTLDQLEILGDYFMEQMHPGELHEIMDERMGGEGSASLKQVHINMGLMFYCGQGGAMSAGMMNVMMGRTGMMQGGIMDFRDPVNSYTPLNNLGYNFFWLFGIIFMILILVIAVLIVILLAKNALKNKRKQK